MAYNENDLTRLKHLVDLGNRIKKVTDDHETRIDTIEKAGYQTASQVENAVKAAVAGALIPSGSVAFADLPAANKDNLNKMFNVTNAFKTTADFVEGAGIDYPAGTNVAIINIGTTEAPSYKYDAYTGVIDTSGFAEKVTPAAPGNFAALDADGNLTDSGHKHSDYLTAHQDISGKADKKVPSAAGNVATLDAEGNLLDSGIASSAVLTSHQDISGKMDKVTTAVSGNLATYGEGGQVIDSGVKFATDADVKAALDAIFPASTPASGD